MTYLCMQARKVEVKCVDFNATFITRMIPKIDWPALRTAAKAVSNSNTCAKCFMCVYRGVGASLEEGQGGLGALSLRKVLRKQSRSKTHSGEF